MTLTNPTIEEILTSKELLESIGYIVMKRCGDCGELVNHPHGYCPARDEYYG
jgi:uncharacterized OB-fold protein